MKSSTTSRLPQAGLELVWGENRHGKQQTCRAGAAHRPTCTPVTLHNKLVTMHQTAQRTHSKVFICLRLLSLTGHP